MTKITKDDIDKVILPGIDYEPQELKDIIAQLELEKQTPDGSDVIVFNGKQYPVMKATYDVIRKTKQTLIFRRKTKSDLNDFFEWQRQYTITEKHEKEVDRINKENHNDEERFRLLKKESERYMNELGNYFKEKIRRKWYLMIPIISRIINWFDERAYRKSWLKLCVLTFGENAKDFALGGLTTGEVQRVMRIFFRFQAESFPAAQETPKKNSPGT